MQLVFAQTARQDLRDIIDYIAQENPAAAEKAFRAIVAAARQLSDFPALGRAGRLPDTRELVVAGLPYLIVYQVARNTVTVIAVFHGARDPGRALAERKRKTAG